MSDQVTSSQVYSATYSGVPVYEILVGKNHVMRRRLDDWVNATHILIVAGCEKAYRTKVLERDVQKKKHEKVQGGYGKYQGTYIPLPLARELADRFEVSELIDPLFNFVTSDVSPPPAPKHTTAATNRSKQAQADATPTRRAKRKRRVAEAPAPTTEVEPATDPALTELGTTTSTEEAEQEITQTSPTSPPQHEHVFFADALLDYLHLRGAGLGNGPESHPQPPIDFHPDTPLDPDGYTVLHWAAALAEMDLFSDFMERGASIGALSNKGETILSFASQYINGFQSQTMPALIDVLGSTIAHTDLTGCTAIHHAAILTSRPDMVRGGQYYIEIFLNYLSERLDRPEVARILDVQNAQGDTAITIVARQGHQPLADLLMGHGADLLIPNETGKSAEHYLREREARILERRLHPPPASGVIQPGTVDQLSGRSRGEQSIDDTTRLTNQLHPQLEWSIHEAVEQVDHERTQIDEEIEEVQAAITRGEAERADLLRRAEAARPQWEALEGDEEKNEDALKLMQIELHTLMMARDRHALPHDPASTSLSASNPESQSRSQTQVENGQVSQEGPEPRRETTYSYLVLQQADFARANLLRDIVRQMTATGSTSTTAQYKTLIASCIGIAEEDVPAMAPTFLQHIEADLDLHP